MKKLVFGSLLLTLFTLYTWSNFDVLEFVVLASVLLFIPLLFHMLDKIRRDGVIQTLALQISYGYPFAALCAVLAFVMESAPFAAVWFVFTLYVSLYAISRILERGIQPLPELAIDVGWLYLGLGGFWFFASVAQISMMGFSNQIILLTAVHFHYSAFIIPIFIGFLGRLSLKRRPLYNLVAIIIMLSPITVAVGITFSRTVEFVSVLIYLLALYLYGYFVWTAPFKKKLAKLLVSLSSIILLVTILFSLIYAYGRVRGMITISIDQMIWVHGVANVVGVITPAIIGWFIEKPVPILNAYGKVMSNITGVRMIGSDFLKRNHLTSEDRYNGLVDRMELFNGPNFNSNKLSKGIADFYERTIDYEMKAKITWSGWFRPFAHIYAIISRRTQQINLGTNQHWQKMEGEIVAVQSEKDRRDHVRAWIRKNECNQTIFVALYSQHKFENEWYMNICLPLPFSNMTGILKPINEGNNLILTSERRKYGDGDEGIYLYTKWFTMRLPLKETFYVRGTEEGRLYAEHEMWIFGLKFLHIEYDIKKGAIKA